MPESWKSKTVLDLKSETASDLKFAPVASSPGCLLLRSLREKFRELKYETDSYFCRIESGCPSVNLSTYQLEEPGRGRGG